MWINLASGNISSSSLIRAVLTGFFKISCLPYVLGTDNGVVDWRDGLRA